ncbi:MAG: amino acid ABC transporter substrate-binding protein, partial [Oscillospiraceae bacterium]|nr:amino acid ABC transporter substrate-binding protein [Oscillospiraceae bacterium]
MKKFLALAMAMVMSLSLAACGGSSSGSAAASAPAASGNKVVKIGVFEPQTGDNGAGGKQEILGMQYANYVQPTVEIGGETY